jgi:hypothetical protein
MGEEEKLGDYILERMEWASCSCSYKNLSMFISSLNFSNSGTCSMARRAA